MMSVGCEGQSSRNWSKAHSMVDKMATSLWNQISYDGQTVTRVGQVCGDRRPTQSEEMRS